MNKSHIVNKPRTSMLFVIIIVISLFMLPACNADKEDVVDRNDDMQTGGHVDYTNPDAPKTIESKEISSFEYTFFIHSSDYDWGSDYESYREIIYNNCKFSLIREEEGARCIGSGYAQFGDEAFDFEFVVALSALDDLQAIIDQNRMAVYNGIYQRTIGIPEGLGGDLKVNYASGERINASDNAGPVSNRDANLAVYDFFLDLAKEADAME